ncbi:MAG TPA: hypothetical protein VGV06_01120, partial [Methylomirabilota bacterium]|nr:hypothetical protein [Methylomirabilota bacterium]
FPLLGLLWLIKAWLVIIERFMPCSLLIYVRARGQEPMALLPVEAGPRSGEECRDIIRVGQLGVQDGE